MSSYPFLVVSVGVTAGDRGRVTEEMSEWFGPAT